MDGKQDAELSRLLIASLGGDEAAYARFLGIAAGLVRGFAMRRIVHGNIDPEDVVQETLLAVHLKRHTWRSDLPVGPWLFAIARFKLVDTFRKVGRRMEIALDDTFDVAAPDPGEAAIDRDISRALETLAPGQRAVISGVSVEGRSIREVAQSLEMTEVAVRVALHRGLRTIAKRFGRT